MMPERINAPGPVLVIAYAPEIAPPTVKLPVNCVLMPTCNARLPSNVTAPVPKFKLFEPMNVKSLDQVCGLTFVNDVAVEASKPTGEP